MEVGLPAQGIFLEREFGIKDLCSGEVVFDGVAPGAVIANVLHWEEMRRVAVSWFGEVIVDGVWEEGWETFDEEGVVDDVFFGALGWGEKEGLLEGWGFLDYCCPGGADALGEEEGADV